MGTASPNDPIRTCVGCREKAQQSTLLRYVALPPDTDGVRWIVQDALRRESGRGAWLHDRGECRHLAENKRVWKRVLRIPSANRAELARENDSVRGGTVHVTKTTTTVSLKAGSSE